MNRRSFLSSAVAVPAAVAVPLAALAKPAPQVSFGYVKNWSSPTDTWELKLKDVIVTKSSGMEWRELPNTLDIPPSE